MRKLKKFSFVPFLLLLGLLFVNPQEAEANCRIKKMKVGFIGICSGEGDSCIKYKGDCPQTIIK